MNVRALVIDDSKIMRGMVMQSLRSAGLAEFEFDEAADGLEGLDKFDPATTDIVFVDWNMPNMGGLDFVRQVRAAGGADQVPIIMITSEGSEKVQQGIDEAGASGYISKPFTVEQLKDKLTPLIQAMAGKAEPGFFTRIAAGG